MTSTDNSLTTTADIDRSRDDAFDTDVVIVGAGPIGLVLANSLAHHGVRFRILERRTEPREYSRANNLWSRPQELLAGVGARTAIADHAYRVTRINVSLNGTMLQQIDGTSGSPFDAVLYSGQDVIETQLEQLLSDRGVSLERGRTVLGHSQDAEGVTVIVGDDRDPADQNGRGDEIRCRYLVGADGDAAVVRDGLGLALELEQFPDRAMRQVDVKLDWRRSTEPDQTWFFAFERGFAGVMPVWGGYHRVFFIEDEADMPYRDPTLEEMRDHLREITGDPTVEMSDMIWSSHGRFQHGIVDSFGRDRVLLAGDAGHHTIPIGGQGMNAGIQDAVTLAWRLAMTLDGAAREPVLDSYRRERRDSRAELDEQQATGFRRLMYRGRIADKAMDLAADKIPNIGVKLIGVDDQHQLGTAYVDSELNDDQFDRAVRDHAVKPGRRAPDAEIVDELAGATRTLFDYLYNPDGHSFGWCLLGFDGGNSGEHAAFAAAFAAVSDFTWIHPWLVAADPSVSPAANATRRLFDLDGTAHDRYGLSGQAALVLVRPDGHVAFRGSAGAGDALVAYADRVGRPA